MQQYRGKPSCLAESTVNAVISKRFAKRQQMQWTKRGAHLLLQTRTRTLDGRGARVVEIPRWRNLLIRNVKPGSWCRRRRSRHDKGYCDRGRGSIPGCGLV
jgi:hypothetical protein